MDKKELSPDAQYIMEKLYGLLNLMERHEQKYQHSKMYLSRERLEQFICLLEKKLGIIPLR